MHGVEDEKKVAVLLTVAGPKTYALVRSLVAPAKPGEKPHLDIVQLIDRNQREHESPCKNFP